MPITSVQRLKACIILAVLISFSTIARAQTVVFQTGYIWSHGPIFEVACVSYQPLKLVSFTHTSGNPAYRFEPDGDPIIGDAANAMFPIMRGLATSWHNSGAIPVFSDDAHFLVGTNDATGLSPREPTEMMGSIIHSSGKLHFEPGDLGGGTPRISQLFRQVQGGGTYDNPPRPPRIFAVNLSGSGMTSHTSFVGLPDRISIIGPTKGYCWVFYPGSTGWQAQTDATIPDASTRIPWFTFEVRPVSRGGGVGFGDFGGTADVITPEFDIPSPDEDLIDEAVEHTIDTTILAPDIPNFNDYQTTEWTFYVPMSGINAVFGTDTPSPSFTLRYQDFDEIIPLIKLPILLGLFFLSVGFILEEFRRY